MAEYECHNCGDQFQEDPGPRHDRVLKVPTDAIGTVRETSGKCGPVFEDGYSLEEDLK